MDAEREMFVRCLGSGSPVILLDAGGSDDSLTWPSEMLHELAERTMVCAYDRAGTGQSDEAPERPRSAADVQADLDALLAAAGIPGPYLLVGSSLGGNFTLYHAMVHSEDVAGLVILDTDWPTTDPEKDALRVALTEEQWKELFGEDGVEQWDDAGNPEHIDFENLSAEMVASIHELPGVPIRILTATSLSSADCPSEWDCELLIEKSIEFQAQWLQLSPDAVRILVEGGHVLHHDNPDAVTQEILIALDAIGG